ncbi:MAG: DNA ligase [Rhodocyclaceae bacterium]|nr:DNA ligase [Rhodocyclaceae bacterium]MDZ4214170.1 DNA ligase [Rhodocyclaceae bacterium]
MKKSAQPLRAASGLTASLLAGRHLLLLLALFTLRAFGAEPPPLLLAASWRSGLDVTQYLVSEKYDGVRGYWDGQHLWTRAGNPIQPPAWFVAALPPQPLDGELWFGRGRFEETSAAIRREIPRDEEWRQIRYQVFELPDAPGTFSERAERIRQIVTDANVPWLVAVEQFHLPDDKALNRRLREVIKAGGEGLMLHRAAAPYVTGRSDALLKLKLWHDAEAVVIGHLPGKGRHAGHLGALRVRAPDGREFSLGTGLSDAQRRDPPPLGAAVTYRYRELTAKGMPRFASFWRVRTGE